MEYSGLQISVNILEVQWHSHGDIAEAEDVFLEYSRVLHAARSRCYFVIVLVMTSL